MPNTINLRLLDNKNIIAELNGIPLAQENSYRIIAGEENATIFNIASKPTQYKDARYTVEMVNSQGYGIPETDIIEDTFALPIGMAVAGYGWVQIRAYLGVEVVPFMTLKVKVWNTLPNWKENIPEPEGSSIRVDNVLSTVSTNPVQNKVITEELNKKLDLVATTDTLQRAYVINANGTQTILPILNGNVTGLTLVQRTSDGRIVCNANSASPNGTAMNIGLFKNMGQAKLYQHNIVINSKYCFSIMCSRGGALNTSTEALSYLATFFANNFDGYTGTKGGVVGFEINGSTITQKVFTSVEEKSNGVYLLSFVGETYSDEEIDTLVDTTAVLL